MARIRTIKPEFWTSEQVMECSPTTRLMFIGMWNFADDKGRLPFSPKGLKAKLFPGDDISNDEMARMIVELSTNGLILIYYVENKGYIEITGWSHQKIDKPQKPKYPEPSENDRRMVSTDRIGKEGIGEERIQDGAKAPIVDLFPKPTDPPSEEKSYFDRAKEILGPKGNGLAAKLKNHIVKKGKPLSDARAVLEQSSSKSDAAAYIGRVIKGPDRSDMGAEMQPGYGDEWG